MENAYISHTNVLDTSFPTFFSHDQCSNQRIFGTNINNYPHVHQPTQKNTSTKDSGDSKNPWKMINKSSSSALFNYPTKKKFPCLQSNKLLKCDEAYASNPQYITEYINDIFKDMLLNNSINKAEWGYFEIIQDEVNSRMRAILIDWLLEVHLKFKFKQETLYLCVIILDRFLALKKITKKRFQLYGITSLFIACKFEEVYPPEISDLVYITNYSCKKEEIIQVEGEILAALDFNIMTICSYTILERLHFMSGLKIEVFHFAQYILQLSLFDTQALCINDFNKALSSLYMAKAVMTIPEKFVDVIQELLVNNKTEIQKYCMLIIKTIKNLNEYNLYACVEKYKSKMFSGVSLSYLKTPY